MAQLDNKEDGSKFEKPLITVINVIEYIKQGGAIGLQAKYGNVKLVEGFKDFREQAARQMMLPIVEAGKRKGFNLRSEIIHPGGVSLGTAIAQYINTNEIDFAITGAGDLLKMKYLLVGGSLAAEIIKNCGCPILLID